MILQITFIWLGVGRPSRKHAIRIGIDLTLQSSHSSRNGMAIECFIFFVSGLCASLEDFHFSAGGLLEKKWSWIASQKERTTSPSSPQDFVRLWKTLSSSSQEIFSSLPIVCQREEKWNRIASWEERMTRPASSSSSELRTRCIRNGRCRLGTLVRSEPNKRSIII